MALSPLIANKPISSRPGTFLPELQRARPGRRTMPLVKAFELWLKQGARAGLREIPPWREARLIALIWAGLEVFLTDVARPGHICRVQFDPHRVVCTECGTMHADKRSTTRASDAEPKLQSGVAALEPAPARM